MNRKVIKRWWFLVLLPLLAAQFYFARRVSEHYPAIMFPGFTEVPEYQDYPFEYSQLSVVGYVGADSFPLAYEQFLAPVPFQAKVFYPIVTDTLVALISTAPGAAPNSNVADLTHYLRQNLESTTGRTFDRIAFRRHTYRAESLQKAYPVRLLEEHVIALVP